MKNATGQVRPFFGRTLNSPHLRRLSAQGLHLARRGSPYLFPLLLISSRSAFAAGGTIDLTGFSGMFQSLQAPALLIGSVLTLISLIFSVFGFMGGNIIRGVTGAFGVLIGGTIIGLGAGWISSLTGQSVG